MRHERQHNRTHYASIEVWGSNVTPLSMTKHESLVMLPIEVAYGTCHESESSATFVGGLSESGLLALRNIFARTRSRMGASI